MARTLPGPTMDSMDMTTILSALADPSRRALMAVLYRLSEPINCAEVVEMAGLDLTSPTISHHYRILREAGLIRTVAEGRKRIVTVRHDDMEARFPDLLKAVLSN